MAKIPEFCFLCDCTTGRAGKYDDSIYDNEGRGPYCEECWEKVSKQSEAQGREDV